MAYINKFINLQDTPESYSGCCNKFVKVCQIEQGIQFDYPTTRYTVNSTTNKEVLVLASGEGITATWDESSSIVKLNFSIPSGIRLFSARIRMIPGAVPNNKLKISMGTTDMQNTSTANRWLPIVHAINENTGTTNGAITVTMDTQNFDTFTINQLTASYVNHVRISF